MADNAAGAPFRARQPHLLDKGGEPMYCPLKPDMALCNPNCAWYTGTPDGVCPECAIYTIAQNLDGCQAILKDLEKDADEISSSTCILATQ